MTSSIEHLSKTRVKITGELPAASFDTYKKTALTELASQVSIDGFRPGTAPHDIVEKKVGSAVVLEEMAHYALSDIYPKLLKEHSIDAIGKPSINITKLGVGSDFAFTIECDTMPVIELPDYVAIAKEHNAKKESTEITDSEIADAILQLRKMRFQNDARANATEETPAPSFEEISEENLPAYDNEFVQSLGGNFVDTADFESKLRENMASEKAMNMRDKNRVAIIDAIIEKIADMELPEVLVNYEADKMMAQMEHDIATAGITFEDYLNHLKKTREEIRSDMMPEARKKTLAQLAINTIGEKEKLTVPHDKVHEELDRLKEFYKDMKDFDEHRAHDYIESMLFNAAVMEFLETR